MDRAEEFKDQIVAKCRKHNALIHRLRYLLDKTPSEPSDTDFIRDAEDREDDRWVTYDRLRFSPPDEKEPECGQFQRHAVYGRFAANEKGAELLLQEYRQYEQKLQQWLSDVNQQNQKILQNLNDLKKLCSQ